MPAISILERVTADDIRYDPFPHLYVRNVLPDDYYKELSDSFLDAARVGKGDDGPWKSPLHLVNACDFTDEAAAPSVWREFAAYHTSQAFFRDVLRVWSDVICRHYPDLEESRGKSLSEFTVGQRQAGRDENEHNLQTDVVLDSQLAVNPPMTETTTIRGPHIDFAAKLYTANFYLRAPDDDSVGADLGMMRYRDERLRVDPDQPIDRDFAPNARIQRLAAIKRRKVETTELIPYEANMLGMWINSPFAIHEVTPRKKTRHHRRYVNIIGECYTVDSEGFFTYESPSAGQGPLERLKGLVAGG